MAFSHGTAAKIYVHTLDMTDFTEEAALATEVAMAESKPLSASFVTRYPGHQAGSVALRGGGYDSAAGKNAIATWTQLAETAPGHPFAFLPAGDVLGRIAHCGTITPNSTQVVVAGDDIVRLPLGYLTLAKQDFCRVLRALAAAGTSPGASYNNVADSHDGGAAYLICTALGAGATLTVTVEHAPDDADWEPLVVMTALTAVGSEVKVVALGTTVDQYLRIAWTLTGGVTTATWFLAFGRR
jgi:hypothetical protein